MAISRTRTIWSGVTKPSPNRPRKHPPKPPPSTPSPQRRAAPNHRRIVYCTGLAWRHRAEIRRRATPLATIRLASRLIFASGSILGAPSSGMFLMHMRQLGNSALSVAPLAFGGNVFGWNVDEKRSFDLLDAFVDAGGNLIDTADVYSAWAPGNRGGESETIIGKWLRRSGKREQVLIATKVAKWAEHPGLSPMNIRQAVDGSLQRLQLDCIDLYFAHQDDASVPMAD